MTQEERMWFAALSESRSNDADSLDKPNMRGVKQSIVDKYSDPAHFVYELIQNADDAKATTSEFELYHDKVVFRHNGERHFSVTNPQTEGVDYDNHRLGDINAITGIGFSSKPEENRKGNTIGKFGLGFKSVFQYTRSPEIYDPEVAFRLERIIVPRLLDHDYDGRCKEETVFVFPFDNKEAFNPVEVIQSKFTSLLFPTLFLNNMKKVSYRYGNLSGEYEKTILEHYEDSVGGRKLEADFIEYRQNASFGNSGVKLWLFSRRDDANLMFSVGCVVNEEGRLVPAPYKGFCYFPTKHDTGLKFIVHAPFLLTDSREGIKSEAPHNVDMVRRLASLFGDSLVVLRRIGEKSNRRLIDDGIVDMLPVSRQEYIDSLDFSPFHDVLVGLFDKERIVPSVEGCVFKGHAYWPESQQLVQLFSTSQLRVLLGNEHASWAFASRWFGGKKNSDDQIYQFINSVVCGRITELSLLDKITGKFIEDQAAEWRSLFYKWLDESEDRRRKARKLPIFIDAQGKACPAFNERDRPVLFLPLQGEDCEFKTVHPELLEDENASALLHRYGISEPDRAVHFRWIVENRLPGTGLDELDVYLKPLFEYYFTLPLGEKATLRNAINGATGFRAINCKTGGISLGQAKSLYFPTEELKEFFADCEALFFVDEEHYVDLVGEEYREDIHAFFSALDVRDVPRIREIELPWEEAYKLGIRWERAKYSQGWTEMQIDGFPEAFTRFEAEFDVANMRKLSKEMWHQLQRISDQPVSVEGLSNSRLLLTKNLRWRLRGQYKYIYRNISHAQPFNSRILTRIWETPWVYGADGSFHRPRDLDSESLSEDYAEFGTSLYSFLDISEYVEPEPSQQQPAEEQFLAGLSDEARTIYETGKAAIDAGYTKEEFERRKKEQDDLKEENRRLRLENARLAHTVTDGNVENTQAVQGRNATSTPDATSKDVDPRDKEGLTSTLETGINDRSLHADGQHLQRPSDGDPSRPVHVVEHTRSRSVRGTASGRIFDEVESILKVPTDKSPPPLPDPFADDDDDDDEQTPRRIDFEKKLREREQREAREIASIERGEELQRKAVIATKYTFGWFKAMLDLEMLGNEKDASDKREVTIRFTRIEREPGTERTFVLKHPSRSLPQWLEELSGISLDMVFCKNVRAVIEVMSVQSYNLRVKLKSAVPLEGVDLATLKEATVAAKSPDFLLTSLREGLNSLPFDDEKSFKGDLTENLEFIFGPPGTGKTTYLATDRIIPMMRRREDLKVLVLAPTNKAADVLAARVVEKDAEGSYSNWLVRFGSTGDEELEKTGVCKGKDVNLADYPRHVVVTTIARFPYDFYIPGNSAPQKLVDQDWDYIVIDEASMIPLVNIVYPFFRKERAHFIVAGDPFQIEPIITNDLWKDENIYTMVGLDNFVDPKTEPRKYPVQKLTTQYRSVPAVGKIFSDYRYGGILKHARVADSLRPLDVTAFPEVRPLTIVKYPVSPYESVYRAKRLGLKGGSSYHIYSALLAFEFVCSLARNMKPQEKIFRVGVISPYRAQANLVQRLLESQTFPGYVQASASTVHGFQGDECEMIVSLFNPPPGLSGRKGAFVNKKNIINVAVSRARDYLVLLMPDDNTENLNNMVEVRKIEALMRHDVDNLIVHEARDVEKVILGSPTFIEDNTFSTGHQMVNVYGIPEQRYEVRTDEGAVDVQLHFNTRVRGPQSNGRSDPQGMVQNSEEFECDVEAIVSGFLKEILRNYHEGIRLDDEGVAKLESSYGHALTPVVRQGLEQNLFLRRDGVWIHPEAIMSVVEQVELAKFAIAGMFKSMTPDMITNLLRSKMANLTAPVDVRGFLQYVKTKYGRS